VSVLYLEQHLERFLFLLNIVKKEVKHIKSTKSRLFCGENVDSQWVYRLDQDEELADRLESFVSRFNRLQDTLGDKLIPTLLKLLGEKTGSAIDNYNKAEKLLLINNVQQWLQIRNLRNNLVHEYMEDAEEFAEAINAAHDYCDELISSYDAISLYASEQLKVT